MKNQIHASIDVLTPKVSHVYSKGICQPPYDSCGVELGITHRQFYKHSILSGLVVVLFFAATLMAKAQIEVSTLAGNDSKGSLIAAIKLANAQKADPAKPVIIRFAKQLSGAIVLSMDLPAIENHISFVGNAANGTPAITIDGSVNPAINQGIKGGISPGFRLFLIKEGKTVSFENLILTKSNQSGIFNEGGTVTVKNCMFILNMGIGRELGSAGAIQNEGGNLTVIGSYFNHNIGGVGGSEGGIGFGGGGGISVINGNAVVINSSFIDNDGGYGGIGVGSVGGAGAIMAIRSNVSVANCTVAGNFGGDCLVTAAAGGFVLVGGNMLVQQSTIVNNSGGMGYGGFGGIDLCSGGAHVLAGTLTLGGTIFVGNINGKDEDTDVDVLTDAELRSSGNNLTGIGHEALNGAGDVSGVELQQVVATTSEGKFQSSILSGFLPTVGLTAGSPAKNQSVGIKSISPVSSTDVSAKFFADSWNMYGSLLQADQNGTKRAAKPSIGAVE